MFRSHLASTEEETSNQIINTKEQQKQNDEILTTKSSHPYFNEVGSLKRITFSSNRNGRGGKEWPRLNKQV